MAYEAKATQAGPALVIYLLDMSVSMLDPAVETEPYDPSAPTKMDVMTKAIMRVIREMVRRSTKGTTASPRYRVAMFAYNDEVRDVFGGARPITEIAEIGVPVLQPNNTTNTAEAFLAAEKLLISMRGELRKSPAPLICHFTDGAFTSDHPRPIVERIQQLTFPDGPVLVENVYFDGEALAEPIEDIYAWPGVSSVDQLASSYARDLYHMSSVIPPSYLELFAERGYKMQPGSRLLFPGDTPEMLEAAFTMSGMTPTV